MMENKYFKKDIKIKKWFYHLLVINIFLSLFSNTIILTDNKLDEDKMYVCEKGECVELEKQDRSFKIDF